MSQDHLNNLEVLTLYSLVDQLAMLFGFDAQIDLLEVVFQEMLGDFIVLALKSYG